MSDDAVKRILGEAHWTRAGFNDLVDKLNMMMRQVGQLPDEQIKAAVKELQQAMGRYTVARNLDAQPDLPVFTKEEILHATIQATGANDWKITDGDYDEMEEAIEAMANEGLYVSDEDLGAYYLESKRTKSFLWLSTVPGTIFISSLAIEDQHGQMIGPNELDGVCRSISEYSNVVSSGFEQALQQIEDAKIDQQGH